MPSPLSKKIILIVALTVTLAACDKPEEKAAKYIKHGNALFAAGDYARARLEYKNALRILPADAEPRYRLGLIDEAEGDVMNAFGDFMIAVQQNKHYRPALMKLAQYYFAAGQDFQAQTRLSEVLAESPADPEAHALRASLLLRHEDWAGSEKEARFALEKDPANITAVSVLTGLYTEKKDAAQAERILDEGIARNPNDTSLLLLKIVLNEKTGDLPAIVATYNSLFTLRPREASYRFNLASTYMSAGKTDAAEAALRQGIAAIPDSTELKKSLVFFLAKNRGMDVAENEARRLLATDPKDSEPYFWLADLYVERNLKDRAVSLLQSVIQKDGLGPYGLRARVILADIRRAEGDTEAAKKLVSEVLEKEPGNQDALFIQAALFSQEGNYRDTIANLRAIIRDNPKAENALRLLAETFMMQEHINLAIDTENQLRDINPANSAATVRLAQMYSLNGDNQKAMSLLDEVTKADPKNPSGWESMARIAITLKDWDKARAAIASLDALDGQRQVATLLKAEAMAGKGDSQVAIPLYLEVINADPSSPLARLALADILTTYRNNKKMEDAVSTLQYIKAQNASVLTALSQCLEELGRGAEAAATLDKALNLPPVPIDAYLLRAQLFQHEGNSDKALAILALAKKQNPADMRIELMTAETLGAMGRYRDAIAEYDAILTNFQPDAARNNMAELIADYEYDDPSALEKARQATESFVTSNNPNYLDTLAWVYYREQKYSQAEIIMQRLLRLNAPLSAETHYHYALLLLKLGKTQEAHGELVKATSAEANYKDVAEAKLLLDKQ